MISARNQNEPVESKSSHTTTMDEITIIRTLTQGSTANISLGKYKNEQVAIKAYYYGIDTRLEKINNEWNILKASFPSEYIVAPVAYVQHPPVIVMEYIDGISLKEALNKESHTWKEKLIFANDIALGLLRLSEKGIAHRDISSDNVLITKNNRAKLIDFGASKFVDSQDPNIITGTIHYIAPEYLLPLSESRSSFSLQAADVYSFGILLIQLIIDKKLFKNYQAISKRASEYLDSEYYYLNRPAAKERLDYISDIIEKCSIYWPLKLKNLIINCTNPDPLKRPELKALQTSLEDIIKNDKMVNHEELSTLSPSEAGYQDSAIESKEPSTKVKIIRLLHIGNSAQTSLADYKNEKIIIKTYYWGRYTGSEHIKQMNYEWNIINACSPSVYIATPKAYSLEPPAISLEYGEANILEDSLKQALTWQQKIMIANDVSLGLLKLLEKGIVHREIASKNILLTKDYHAKIMDFSKAKYIDSKEDISRSIASTLTRPIQPSLEYMAPECITPPYNNFLTCEAMDVYSFGILLIELAVTSEKFKAYKDVCFPPEYKNYRGITAKSRNVMSDHIKKIIKDESKNWPIKLKNLIIDCINEDPRKRPSMTIVQAQLGDMLRKERMFDPPPVTRTRQSIFAKDRVIPLDTLDDDEALLPRCMI